MAFENFQENTPVIILGDGDTSQADIYKRTRIVDGVEATPDVFNTSIQDSINRDVSLEDALTYLARSASLYTTNNSKFLSHCEGTGIDVISSKAPDVGTSSTGNIFVSDDTFLGAAYPQGYLENIIGVSGGGIKTNHPYKNTTEGGEATGWSFTKTSEWTEGIDYTIDESNSTDNPYAKISTAGESKTSLSTPGYIQYTMSKCPLVVHRDGSSIGTHPEKISASIYLKTENNLVLTNTAITLTVRFYKELSSTSPIDGYTQEKVLDNKSEYDDLIRLENIACPTNAGYFDVVIKVEFKDTSSLATFYISKIMVQDGENCTHYIETTASGSTCQYKEVLDLESNNYTGTILCWCKFRSYALQTISQQYMGPLFACFNRNVSIGGVHLNEWAANMKMQLLINNNGVSITDSNIIDDEFLETYKDKYILTALRFRPHDTDTTKVIVEYVVAVSNKVFISTTTIDKTLVSGKGTIIAGYDSSYNSADKTYAPESHGDYFECPVTEIRYDEEWLNDLELYILSLTKKPFSYKQSTDSQITTKTKTVTEVLDEAGINIIPNPTGRMGFINWTNKSGFSVLHLDPNLGNCFKYTGTPSTKQVLYTDYITVNPSTTYTLRGMMRSDNGSSGDIGIGLRLVTNTSIAFDPTGSTSGDLLLKSLHTTKAKYYSGSIQTNSNTVAVAVYVYVMPGATANASYWGKLKLEAGSSATYFTDDSGANYAIYY